MVKNGKFGWSSFCCFAATVTAVVFWVTNLSVAMACLLLFQSFDSPIDSVNGAAAMNRPAINGLIGLMPLLVARLGVNYVHYINI